MDQLELRLGTCGGHPGPHRGTWVLRKGIPSLQLFAKKLERLETGSQKEQSEDSWSWNLCDLYIVIHPK